MRPIPVPFYIRMLDYGMSPFMRIVSGAPLERPQESHFWHSQKLTEQDFENLNKSLTLTLRGNESSHIETGAGPWFHIPLIGGWRNYVVVEVSTIVKPWHIGWFVRDTLGGSLLRADFHTLPIYDSRLRLLLGTPARTTTFFAVDASGTQISLTEVGRGKMGDGSQFKHIRLF